MNAFIRLLYALFIAAAVTAFVGTGIATFYSAPKGPTFPTYSSQNGYQDYQHQVDMFRPTRQNYYRNVSIVVLVLAVLIVAGGLLLLNRMEVIGEGIAIGGVFTTVYGAIAAGISDNHKLVFVSVTLLLASSLVIAYRRFLAQSATRKG